MTQTVWMRKMLGQCRILIGKIPAWALVKYIDLANEEVMFLPCDRKGNLTNNQPKILPRSEFFDRYEPA